tara:strand:+ start:468 stop:851 length:384 start_codon:yes stop_codon:yes gene_type:complete
MMENIKIVNSKFSPALKRACAAKEHGDILKHGIKQFGPLKVMAFSHDRESGKKGRLYGLSISLGKNVRGMFMAWIWTYFDAELNRPIMQVVKAHELSGIDLYNVDPSLKHMIKCLHAPTRIEEDIGA